MTARGQNRHTHRKNLCKKGRSGSPPRSAVKYEGRSLRTMGVGIRRRSRHGRQERLLLSLYHLGEEPPLHSFPYRTTHHQPFLCSVWSTRYNQVVVRTLRLFACCSALLAAMAACVCAQTQTHSTDTIIVIPFANASGAPGLQWISEAFPAFLSQRLASPNIFPLTREDRMRAYDRAGIPPEIQPTRATVYRLVEAMDVDYVILGRYTFDGRTFTAAAQPLEMQHHRLLPEVTESGALTDLINVQATLAWDLMHAIQPDAPVDRQSFISATPAVRLDAFENYIRGVTAGTNAEKITRFREAVRLNPSYNEAWLRLGRTYFDDSQFDETISALSHVPPIDP